MGGEQAGNLLLAIDPTYKIEKKINELAHYNNP